MRNSRIQEQWSNWLESVLLVRRRYIFFFFCGSASRVCTVCTRWLSGLHVDSRRHRLQRATQLSFMEHLRPSRESVAICRISCSSWMGLSRPFSCLCTAPSLLRGPECDAFSTPISRWISLASTLPGQYQSFYFASRKFQRFFWH